MLCCLPEQQKKNLDAAAFAKFREVFQETMNPSKEKKKELAREFNLPIRKVGNWFGSQRFKVKNQPPMRKVRLMVEGKMRESPLDAQFCLLDDLLLSLSLCLSVCLSVVFVSRLSVLCCLPEQQQKSRSNLDAAAVATFREVFQKNDNPSMEKRLELAKEFNLPILKVSNWFGSQRFEVKKNGK